MRKLIEDHEREIRRLYRLMGEVFNGHEKIDETEDGYTLVYPSEESWRRKLEQLREEMRRRCPAVEV